MKPQHPRSKVMSTRSVHALDSRRMASAATLVMILFVASRAAGLFREIIIGAQFGTSAELDAYLAAFRIPDLLFQLVAGGALGSAFIPTFASVWARDSHEAAWLLFSRVLNLVVLALVALSLVVMFLAPVLVQRVIAPGFTPEQQALTVRLMRWMLASTIIFGASGLIMGALNAVQHFLLPAAAPVLYNLAIILGAWLLAPRMGVYGLVVGVVLGAVAHLGVQVPGLVRQKARYQFTFAWRNRDVQEVGRLMAPRVLGLLFVQLNFLVNTILASGLAPGSLSALNYAWLLMLLPQGIFAQAIATVAFPTFAAQAAAGERRELARTLSGILRMVLFLTLPAAVGLYVLRTPLIQILLQRGAFDEHSTAAVAYALQFYAIGLVAHSVVEIVVRAFYALHDTLTPVVVGVMAMALNIGLSLLWIGALGHGGLALANSTATIIEMLALLWLMRRRLGGLEESQIGASLTRTAAAAMITGGALVIWLSWLPNAASWVNRLPLGWVAGFGGLLVAGVVYAGSGWLLGHPELQASWRLIRRRTLTEN